MYHSQIQVLQFLKQKSETDTLTLLEQNLTVAAFYEDMRCFSASKKYCKDNPYCKFQYPKPDDVRTKRLQKAGITDTDELAAAVECFDTLLQSAVIPPDPNAIRLRDIKNTLPPSVRDIHAVRTHIPCFRATVQYHRRSHQSHKDRT